MDYADYQHLAFERRPNGVVLVTINRPEVLNATNARLHWELHPDLAHARRRCERARRRRHRRRRAFSAGGDLAMVEAIAATRSAWPARCARPRTSSTT